MSSQRYDVFISFRGEQSAKDAHLIYYALKSRGYNAFLDVIELTESGELTEKLKEAIENCENFVPLLSPGALDERAEEMDWVRFELEKAHELQKKTIPVVFEGFKFPQGLPDNVKYVMNRVRISFPLDMSYFDAFIDRLVQSLKSKPRYILNQAGEISDSWAEIIKAIDDGTAQRRYAIGAWKPLDLGRFGVVNMQLAGFYLDVRADGRGKASTTWIARELLTEAHAMHKDWENWAETGWEKSELKDWLQNEVLSTFPNGLRDRLVSITKQQQANDIAWNKYTQTTKDRL